MSQSNVLLAISPLDGRYQSKVSELGEVFSEYGLVKRRVAVECAWLAALCANDEIKEAAKLSEDEAKFLDSTASEFSVTDAARVKEIESTTNHDVKAV
jgi:adenylosuccinate lyase